MPMIVEPYLLPVQILPVRVTSPTVNLYYPQVTGLRDIRIQQHMNQLIYQQFHSIIKQQGYYENPAQTEMTGIYEIKTNERGILSLTQSNYTYIYMHANGLTITKSLTFDTRTGKSYTMNLSHLHSMKRWEFLTISIEEASAQKKAVSFHSMPTSEVFLMGPVSNIGITPMGRSNPSTTSCLRNP
jgi:hypothetical protein